MTGKNKNNIKIKKVLHTFCHLFSIHSFSFLNLLVQFCCFWFTFMPFWTPCFYITTILRLFTFKPKLAIISFMNFLRRLDAIIWFLQQVWNEKIAFSAICTIYQIQKLKNKKSFSSHCRQGCILLIHVFVSLFIK